MTQNIADSIEHQPIRNASIPSTTRIRVQTADEQEHVFELQSQAENDTSLTMGSRIEKLLNRKSFAVEVDNHLLIIPMTQIRSIEVGPLQTRLPEAAVPHVVRIS